MGPRNRAAPRRAASAALLQRRGQETEAEAEIEAESEAEANAKGSGTSKGSRDFLNRS